MKRYPSLSKARIGTIIGLALLVVAWIMLMPAQFGGRTVYLVISGISMEPTFYTGDLAILHQTDNYQIGDIAAYYHPAAGGVIIHRIVGQEDGRFILLGDNKPDVDPYRPTLTDMVGKYWLHIPAIGNLISQAQALGWLSPNILAVVLGVLLIPSITIGQIQSRQKRRRNGSNQKANPGMDQFNLSKLNKADVTSFLIVMALASAMLAYFGFNQPLSGTVSNELAYEHKGTFSYSAAAPPGIYNSDEVQTGEPIFRQLINQVTVNFDYQLASDLPGDIAGTYRLIAEVSHANGWDRTIEILPETSFTGKNLNISSVIDLSEIQGLLDNVEQQTGLQGQRYTLAIVPEISVRGTLNGQVLQDEFSPRLAFEFDATQMQLADSGPNRPNGQPDDPLKPSQRGTIAGIVEAPNEISLLNFSLTMLRVRQIAIVGLVLSLGSLLVYGLLMSRVEQGDEVSQIQFKYGSRLINIQETSLEATNEVIEVATIEDLVRLAEQGGRMILHHANGAQHQYLVKDEAITYRYQIHHELPDSDPSTPTRK